jgi:hypothetical protein
VIFPVPESFRQPMSMTSPRNPVPFCKSKVLRFNGFRQSHVTGDRIHRVYIAPNPDMIGEHAKRGGFPANKVAEGRTIIDPPTAE